MSYSLGIDLGTSNCCVAYCDQTNQCHVIPVQSEQLLESIVDFYDPTNIKVGKGVRNSKKSFKEGTVVRCNKRVLGREFDDTKINGFKEFCEAEVVKDDYGFCAYNIPRMGGLVSTEDVVVELLKVLYKAALDSKDNKEPEVVCITIPATFTQKQRYITRKAAKRVIKNCPIKFISEPSAAAIHYSLSTSIQNGHVLIYDIGGGTFDVSIIRITDGNQYDILGTNGHPTIGGSLFDKLLLTLVCEMYEKQQDEDDELLPRKEEDGQVVYESSMHKLLDMVREKKEHLSSPNSNEVEIDVNEYFAHLREERKREGINDYEDDDDDAIESCNEITITRDDFERLIKDHIKTTIDLTKECIVKCGLSKNDIDHILLVGGSSHIPLIKRLLKEEFGNKIGADINADTCVACGAALRGQRDFASIVENRVFITERSTFSIAIKAKEGFKELIPIKSELPNSGYQDYHLDARNNGYFRCPLFEKRSNGQEYEQIRRITVVDDSFYKRAANIRVKFILTLEGELTVTLINLDDNGRILREETNVLDF